MLGFCKIGCCSRGLLCWFLEGSWTLFCLLDFSWHLVPPSASRFSCCLICFVKLRLHICGFLKFLDLYFTFLLVFMNCLSHKFPMNDLCIFSASNNATHWFTEPIPGLSLHLRLAFVVFLGGILEFLKNYVALTVLMFWRYWSCRQENLRLATQRCKFQQMVINFWRYKEHFFSLFWINFVSASLFFRIGCCNVWFMDPFLQSLDKLTIHLHDSSCGFAFLV